MIQPKIRLDSWIFLVYNVKNIFVPSLWSTSTLLCIFTVATELRQSDFIVDLNHVLNLLMAEKLRTHSAEVTAKVQPIFIKVKTIWNFNLSQCLIASVRLAGRFSFCILLHFLFHYFSSKPMSSGLGKSSEYCSSSLSMLAGTSTRRLEAVFLNELNLNVISVINWWANNITGALQ